MHTTTACLAAALLAFTATSCSDEPSTTGRPGSALSTTAPASPSPTASEEPATGPLKIDQAWEWAREGDAEYPATSGTTTVLGYEQPVRVYFAPEQSGYVWATLEVKVCNAKDSNTMTISRLPWSLAYKDGARAQISGSSGGDMPKPEYPPVDTPLTPGDCIRGKIPFEVPGDQRPERAVYAPADFERPIEWTVPVK